MRDQCWMCDDYKLYKPEDKKILSPKQVQARAERKAKKEQLKQSDASKRGKRAKKKGYTGETEVVKLLQQFNIKAERVPLSGALKSDKYSCDVTCQVKDSIKRIEVKRRKSGMKTIQKWLNEDKNSNYVFFREDGDRENWVVIMPMQEFIELIKEGK
jgi:Holliday junction resolvase